MCLRRLLFETLTALVLVLMPCAGMAAFDVQLQSGSEQVLGPPYTAAVSTVGPDELVDGETLTLDDLFLLSVVFAFDTLGNGVPPGSVPVYLASASDAADVRDALIDAINAAGFSAITATTGRGRRHSS
jgi:hypothetical protein